MLSRIGNSLFWMGRYLERSEHIARYTRVQYVASVDSPLAHNQENVLESILHMTANWEGYFQTQQQLEANAVINYTAISEDNSFSILSYIDRVRENARGARDSISIELWEAINSFYHKINAYAAAGLHAEEIEYFARRIEENSYVMKGYIDNTLLRNDVWQLIYLGMHLERAIQIILILQTKFKDREKMLSGPDYAAYENFIWTSTLLSVESFDMYMRCQKTAPDKHHVLNFLLFDTAFPKSVAFSLNTVKQCINEISFQEEKKQGFIHFEAGKLACNFQYTTVKDIEENPVEFLNTTLESIYALAHLLDAKYLKYN
ncbi:alpha-E domain-containing protein [Rufibacter immobilis]|uniref:Alpha-E domain-containing protein n=1 Tax=Rufibacter immobilis TaxID=1348778 RepID=A0A3M9MPM9_9BACT|nr:alpha-E domain-containing protein [Rufibacter immobilis]RNI27157.1 alpha-E domain-containing protein [Rufibacter immobilis]